MSFFLAATDDREASSARSTIAIHKENVPLSDKQKELYRFQKHSETFTGLEEIARSTGSGENHEVMIARQSAADKKWR